MTDKKTFGAFIKSKRTEKNYSQKELADLLFVTETAVSKWERGISYPDITLISDICRVLDISEHEFVTASNDNAQRQIKRDAIKFRLISGLWFWVPTILYTVALFVCFICNLAVNHTLSWFFIVLSSFVCAYSFVPTFTSFFATNRKLLSFVATTYLSICLLLFTCAIYTDGFSWFLNSCIGVLMGYVQLFVPILATKYRVSRYKFVVSFTATFLLTILLLINVNAWQPIELIPSILLTCYCFLLAILITFVCTLRFDVFLKTTVCVTLGVIMFYPLEYITCRLFGEEYNNYRVDLYDWKTCLEGNIHFVCLVSFVLISMVFAVIGILRIRKKQKIDSE